MKDKTKESLAYWVGIGAIIFIVIVILLQVILK